MQTKSRWNHSSFICVFHYWSVIIWMNCNILSLCWSIMHVPPPNPSSLKGNFFLKVIFIKILKNTRILSSFSIFNFLENLEFQIKKIKFDLLFWNSLRNFIIFEKSKINFEHSKIYLENSIFIYLTEFLYFWIIYRNKLQKEIWFSRNFSRA